MYIDFEKFPFKITNVNFDEDSIFDGYPSLINIETNGNKNFKLIAVGDCCSSSVFRIWKDYQFEKLVGKTIKSLKAIEFPDDFDLEDEEDDDLCLSAHLYEFTFVENDEVFKFMLVNYSNGYYDGWINAEVIDK